MERTSPLELWSLLFPSRHGHEMRCAKPTSQASVASLSFPWRKRLLMHAAGVLQVPGLTSAIALFREMFVYQLQVALRSLIGYCKWCEIGNGAFESLGKEC